LFLSAPPKILRFAQDDNKVALYEKHFHLDFPLRYHICSAILPNRLKPISIVAVLEKMARAQLFF